jgi:alpha-glucosidase
LVFDYQYDPTVRDIDDQYLLGPDFLVAPVTTRGQTARHVYLPSGRWYDWHSGDAVSGGQFVLVPTPMDRIPLYARGGAVIPMWPEAPPSTDYHPTAVELHLFVPDGDSVHRTFLQEDDGLTIAAQDGAMYRTTFELIRAGSSVRLRAEVSGRGFPEFARREFRLFVHGATPDVTVDGQLMTATEDYVVIPNAGTGFTAGFELGSCS